MKNRLHARRSLWRACRDSRSPILVYQMGKVGSTSITQALKRALDRPVFKVHRLNPARINQVIRKLTKEDRIVPWDLRFGKEIYKKLIAPGRRCQVISLVRDPIERNISGYFEFLDNLYRTRNAHEKLAISELLSRFVSTYSQNFALNWFDEEMKMVFGLDVYSQEFPTEKKAVTISNERCDLLLLRVDLSDEEKSQAISSFLNTPVKISKEHNVSRKKAYGKLYEEFRERIEMPPLFVEQALSSRLVRHFYSEAERKAMMTRWAKDPGLYKEQESQEHSS